MVSMGDTKHGHHLNLKNFEIINKFFLFFRFTKKNYFSKSLPNLTFELPWTTEDKTFIVEAYFRQRSIRAAQLQFNERFGCREFPLHSMIYRWVNKFRTHGTVNKLNGKDTNRQSHSGRQKSSRTPHNVAVVRDSLSTAQASLCIGKVRSLESTGSPSCASGFATRLTLCQTLLTMSCFRTRHIFCCQVT